jgi:hypothetical protein
MFSFYVLSGLSYPVYLIRSTDTSQAQALRLIATLCSGDNLPLQVRLCVGRIT